MINKFLLSSCIIFFFITVVLGFMFLYHSNVIKEQDNYISNLKASNELLIEGRKNDYQNKVELAERVEELSKLAEQDKNCFTWHTNISNSPVIQRLRQDPNKVR